MKIWYDENVEKKEFEKRQSERENTKLSDAAVKCRSAFSAVCCYNSFHCSFAPRSGA